MRICWLIFTCILLFALDGRTQNLRLDYLFAPGLEMGAEFMNRSAINDSVDFGYYQWNTQVTIPLKTKLDASINWEEIKKLDFSSANVKASQNFFTLGYAQKNPNNIGLGDTESVNKISLGYTGLSAGLLSGIWIYSANLFVDENNKFSEGFNPNFLGYFARVKLNNLKFIYFYGAALVYNQKQTIPTPLFGFTTLVAPRTRLTAILPLQILLNYKVSRAVRVQLGTKYQGLNSIARFDNRETINFTSMKSFCGVKFKLGTSVIFSVEGGYNWWRNFRYLGFDDEIASVSIGDVPYVGVNVKYKLGKSLFHNKLESLD